ncbi:MAG: Eco57I restriction-modification methylase domain-containing protein [Kofleriaceae bacterium]
MPAARPAHARPLGVVYTPREVAEPMVRVALEPLIHGRSSTELLALRVCDPALGEGAFLVEVVRVLAEAVRAAWRTEGITRDDAEHAVASQCIAGIDVDPRAVEHAQQALGVGGEALRVGDALVLDWTHAFPGGFDAVVGNPPYIRQEHLAAHKPGLAAFEVYDGVADLYVYFLELAHRILRPGGRYCLITPNKWLTAAYGRPLRTFLAARGSVEGLVDLSRATVFRDADAFASIVWGRTDRRSRRRFAPRGSSPVVPSPRRCAIRIIRNRARTGTRSRGTSTPPTIAR